MTQADLLTREQVLEHLKHLILAYGMMGDHNTIAPAINALNAHDSAQRSVALPPAMTWTTTKPTKEGWYWYRNDGEPPSVVEVYEHPDKGFHMSGPQVNHCCIADLAVDEEFSGSEWCGPIAPPMEPPQ